MKSGFYFFFILISTLIISCSGVKRLGTVNTAERLNPDSRALQPIFTIHHINENVTRVQMAIPSDQLLYIRSARDEFYLSRFRLNLSVFDKDVTRKPITTAEKEFTDTLIIDYVKQVSGELTINIDLGRDYFLHIRMEDLLRRNRVEDVILVNKSGGFSKGFFHLPDNRDAESFSNQVFAVNQGDISLWHSHRKEFRMDVAGRSFPDQFPMAPYVVTEEEQGSSQSQLEPDTLFSVFFRNGKADIKLPQKGIYRFHEPGNISNGFTLFYFWPGFPWVSNDENMLRPLRYITSYGEFSSLFEHNDARHSSERFWIRITGNPDRAVSVMNRYNQRVANANRFFTSNLPGWQTDRGMIYIIFGVPDTVIRNSSGETWFYNASIHFQSMEYQFQRKVDDFSEIEYILTRSTAHRNNWNLAVDRWRR